MKKFKLQWRTGKVEIIEGNSIEEAVNKHYSRGALAALDYWEEIKPMTFQEFMPLLKELAEATKTYSVPFEMVRKPLYKICEDVACEIFVKDLDQEKHSKAVKALRTVLTNLNETGNMGLEGDLEEVSNG